MGREYRYLAVYNWSAACNISEIEIWSNVNTVMEEEDKEASKPDGRMMRKMELPERFYPRTC